MDSNDEGGNNGTYQQNSLAAKCTGLGFLVSVYLAGLLACVIAGATAPDLFTSTTTVPFTPSGISSASSDYALPTTGFKEAHQSIYFAMRLNVPSQLQHAMDLSDDRTFETDGSFTITVYGSPQPTLRSSVCPSGCITCPDGNEALGLTCSLLSFQRGGQETISCASGQDWCSWMPLHNIDFVYFTTYYWVVATDNGIDEYLENIDTDSEEDWVAEFRSLFVSERYTSFEIAWFYFWISATLLVMFAPRYGFFTVALRERVYWSKWSRQQKWVGVLLVGLFFFNNPFFAAQVRSPFKKGFFVFFAVMDGFMITALLLFWLERLFHFGRGPDGNRSKECVARGSQWILGIFIFATYVANMIILRISRRGEPNRIHKYPSTSSNGEQTLTILCFVYCAWLIIFAGRVWLWGGMGDALRSSTRVKFFALSSGITLVILIPSIVLEHLSPRVRGGVPFSLATGGCNIYVLAMALLCTPRHVEPPSINVVDGNRAPDEDILSPTSLRPGNEDFEAPSTEPSPAWWKPKRPKVADSSAWEYVQSRAVR